MTCRVFHRERAGAAMQPLFDALEARLDFDCTVPATGGNRRDADQLVLWKEGRALTPGADPSLEGSWHYVDPVHQTGVVTHAFTAEDSGHGHSAAADVLPVRSHLSNGMPASVWLGSEPDPVERAEAIRLQGLISDVARTMGYECGADWPAGVRDADHYQAPGWRNLPRFG